jgi:hypothetical protein
MRFGFLILMLMSEARGQQRILSVCETLDSARDHQTVTVRGLFLQHAHGAALLEEGLDFCHPDRYFNEQARHQDGIPKHG